jgi:DNA replication protein DnaC
VQARLNVLTHPALLVVDEIGYLPINRTGRHAFVSAHDTLLRARQPCHVKLRSPFGHVK